MALIAGVDVGNSTTEVAIARIDNFIWISSLVNDRTTGVKGTKQNIRGIINALNDASVTTLLLVITHIAQ